MFSKLPFSIMKAKSIWVFILKQKNETFTDTYGWRNETFRKIPSQNTQNNSTS